MDLTQPIAGQKRRPRAEIRHLVAEFVSSGMPGIEFCRSRGLSRSTLYHHLEHQRSQPNPDPVSADTQLVRVELAGVSRSVASSGGGLVVVLASGRRIEVSRGFDAATLERLVSVGARAQAVLTSILQTAKQQGKNPFDVLVKLLCCGDKQKILDLVPPTRETLQDSSPDPPTQIPAPEIIYVQSVAGLAVPA